MRDVSTFLDNFTLVAGAPGGVARIRNLILQLAVRGELVTNAWSKRAGGLGVVVRDGPGPVVDSVIPPNWTIGGFRSVGSWATGYGFPTRYQGRADLEFLFCKVSDMNRAGNEKFIFTTANTVDMQILGELRAKAHPAGTTVFPKIGGAIATNKRRLLVQPTVIDNNCLGLIPKAETSAEWLNLLLRSIDFTKYQSGTSVPALSQGTLDRVTFGIPPKNEQEEIVAKVDELMELCDVLASHLEVQGRRLQRLSAALTNVD